jgi:hypothetical protein
MFSAMFSTWYGYWSSPFYWIFFRGFAESRRLRERYSAPLIWLAYLELALARQVRMDTIAGVEWMRLGELWNSDE